MPLTLELIARAALPRVDPGRALASRERMTLVRVAEAFLEGAPAEVSAEQAADNVEQFLVAGRSRRAWRVRVLLTAIEVSSLLTHGRGFSHLGRDERRAIIRDRWSRGRHVNRILAKVRNLVILGIYGDPLAAVATGYVPVSMRPRFRGEASLARSASDVSPREVT